MRHDSPQAQIYGPSAVATLLLAATEGSVQGKSTALLKSHSTEDANSDYRQKTENAQCELHSQKKSPHKPAGRPFKVRAVSPSCSESLNVPQQSALNILAPATLAHVSASRGQNDCISSLCLFASIE